MNTFDSYGARQESEEEIIVGEDWEGKPIRKNDKVYFINMEIVLEEELEEYIASKYGKSQYA